jgi:hypothetical protein
MEFKTFQMFIILSLFSIIITSNANTSVNQVSLDIDVLSKKIDFLKSGKIQFYFLNYSNVIKSLIGFS